MLWWRRPQSPKRRGARGEASALLVAEGSQGTTPTSAYLGHQIVPFSRHTVLQELSSQEQNGLFYFYLFPAVISMNSSLLPHNTPLSPPPPKGFSSSPLVPLESSTVRPSSHHPSDVALLRVTSDLHDQG